MEIVKVYLLSLTTVCPDFAASLPMVNCPCPFPLAVRTMMQLLPGGTGSVTEQVDLSSSESKGPLRTRSVKLRGSFPVLFMVRFWDDEEPNLVGTGSLRCRHCC
jgi:hypothetical protein